MERATGGLLNQWRVERTAGRLLDRQRVGGMAALYLAVAYLAAIPYFLLVLDYQGVVDPAANDFHLQDRSPARNAGTPQPVGALDFDGMPRSDDGWSVGPYQ